MTAGPRLFQKVVIQRPTVQDFGDLTLSGVGTVDGAVWPRRRKQIVGGNGELFEVTAIGFLASGTDVRLRDRITLSGQWAGTTYEVLNVVSAFDDRGILNHVGVELRDVD